MLQVIDERTLSISGGGDRGTTRDEMTGAQTPFRTLIKESHEFIANLLPKFPRVDRRLIEYYFIDEMTQDQIARLLDISQAAVSHRVGRIKQRLKLLLKQPSTNALQVRRDLRTVLPDSLWEIAVVFYWEHTQNRVKNLIETSQSGAANKFRAVLRHLQAVKDTADQNNPAHQEVYLIASQYLEFFEFISVRSNVTSFLYKKNDNIRKMALTKGPPIVTFPQVQMECNRPSTQILSRPDNGRTAEISSARIGPSFPEQVHAHQGAGAHA